MKEVCGFLGLDNKFYKTKGECHEADLQYKMNSIQYKLDNFSKQIENIIFSPPDRNDIDFAIVAKVILEEKDNFLKVLADHKALEKELDELYLKSNRPWWMNIIWWK